METYLTSSSNHIVQQAGLMQKAGVYNSTDLTLRTREGDVVTLSTNKQLAYSESAKHTRFEDGTSIEEFSTVALAASQYSMAIQGDLNEEELYAIEQLVQKISPVAHSFFNQSGFDIEKTAESLVKSMGVIDRVALKLEQTTVKTVYGQYYVEKGTEESENPPENVGEVLPSLQSLNIRDVAALVQSVVESLFRQEKVEFQDDNSILRSLSDLIQHFTSRLLPSDALQNKHTDAIQNI